MSHSQVEGRVIGLRRPAPSYILSRPLSSHWQLCSMTCFDVRIFFHLTHFSWTFIGNVSRSLSFVSVQALKLPFFSDRADSVQHSSASISKLHNFLIFVRPPAPALLGTIRSVARVPGTSCTCCFHGQKRFQRVRPQDAAASARGSLLSGLHQQTFSMVGCTSKKLREKQKKK